MIWHPLVLAVLTLELVSLVLMGSAAIPYGRVLLDWDPDSTGRRQISLEAAVEGASVATRAALALTISSTLLFVGGVALVFPSLVTGAMCGTGVLQAMEGLGGQALLLHGLGLAVLWVWRTLDGLNRTPTRPPAMGAVARWQLLALPLLAAGALTTFRAFRQLDPQAPVSCCQVIYGRVGADGATDVLSGFGGQAWLVLFALGAVVVVVLAGRAWLRATPSSLALPALTVVVWAWVPVAALYLVRVLTPYHYEVLDHPCPWCLFLPEHAVVGVPLFSALGLMLLESLSALTASRLAVAHPQLDGEARRRQKWASLAIVGALLCFLALGVGPTLLWRLSHGVWMQG